MSTLSNLLPVGAAQGTGARAGSSDRLRLAIVGGGAPWPSAVTGLLGGTGWCASQVFSADDFIATPNSPAAFDAVVVCEPRSRDAPAAESTDDGMSPRLAEATRLRGRAGRSAAIVWLNHAPDATDALPPGAIVLAADTSTEQLRGALTALTQTRPTIERIEGELSSLYALGNQLHTHFDELQRDLTLAARLQRDFLPRELPDAPGIRFATLYRPCSWISGDMLDVFRVDEHRIGFYVMDAMGHGVAAALLTMFLRNAIRPRRGTSEGGEWLRPREVMVHLNDVLVDQRLPDCQFVTGWYGVLDTRTRALTYCNGGHPPALRIARDGSVESLRGEGCLMGVFDGRAFTDQTVQLREGDRVLVFSDGLEETLVRETADGAGVELVDPIPRLVARSAQDFVTGLTDHLDDCPGAFSQRVDDISIIAVEIV